MAVIALTVVCGTFIALKASTQAHLHALPCQSSFKQVCGVLVNSICIGEALVPFDQSAMVHTVLMQRKAEAEAHYSFLAWLWPADPNYSMTYNLCNSCDNMVQKILLVL